MIVRVLQLFVESFRAAAAGWDRFWFSAASPRLLGIMRICVGAMLTYTHLVWSLGLQVFFGPTGVLPSRYAELLYGDTTGLWTHFAWVQSPWAMWLTHIAAILTMSFFTIGLWTRVTSILSFLFFVSYAHRATGALFGLDQINGFLALYLAIGPCGAAYSCDQWLRGKRGQHERANSSVLANISLRMIQVHLCVVYLFAGLSKLQGPSWWNGEAMWGALASLDYQTIDLTWMAQAMWLVNLTTLVSLAWEVSYPFLIWNRHARPFYLTLAVLVHLGIGLFMGMLTFGLIMIVANMAFLDPDLKFPGRNGRAGERG